MTAPGVHISFFDAGEAVARELPAIGPLHGVLLRGDRLVIEHADVAVPDEPGVAVTRWLEGVVEMQRATGETPGGRRRASMRVSAPDGLYLRFGAVGEPAASLRELGPFDRVFIGARTIEALGEVLASRPSRDGGVWTLTADADPDAVGAQRPDVGFRSTRTPYHTWMTVPRMHPTQVAPAPSPPTAAAVAQPSGTAPSEPPPTTAPSQRALKDSDFDLLQRRDRRQKEGEAREAGNARAGVEAREAARGREAALRQATADEDTDSTREGVAPLLARMGGSLRTEPGAMSTETSIEELSRVSARRWARFVVVAVMVIVLGAFGALFVRDALSGTSGTVVGIGKLVKGAHWDYTVATVTRGPQVSASRAQGMYLIVWVTATNRQASGAALFPSGFRLVDGSGTQYSALADSDPVYQSPGNPGSPLTWMTSYPAGQAVSTPVVFDIDPTLRGVQLMILEAPTVRVRLD